MGFLTLRAKPPRPSGPPAADVFAQFRVDDARERLSLLRQLRDQGIPLVVSGPAGGSLRTILRSVDFERGSVALDVEPGDMALRQLIDADEATAVGYLQSIKLQFDLHELMLVCGSQDSTLQARLPDQLWRFQRRAGYRLRTLDRHSPTASFVHPVLPEMRLALRILDVSVGGCALLLPENTPPVPLGMILHGATLALDAGTQLRTSLLLQHASSLQAPLTGLRLGCELPDLDADGRRRLQRYIDQTQKRRRLLAQE